MSLLNSCPFLPWNTVLILSLIAWTLPWKGVALWRAAGNRHLWWFVALFLLNTLAILEIVYIFGFSKRKGSATEQPES